MIATQGNNTRDRVIRCVGCPARHDLFVISDTLDCYQLAVVYLVCLIELLESHSIILELSASLPQQ